CVEVSPNYVPCWPGYPTGAGLITPRQYLNEVACMGWPWHPGLDEPMQPPWVAYDDGDRALFAETPRDLEAALDLIIGNFTANVATRTEVVTSNVVLNNDIGATQIVEQYDFNSGYIASPGKPWQGVLTRTDISCRDTGSDAGPLTSANDKDFAESLDTQPERTFYTLPHRPNPADPLLSSADYSGGPLAGVDKLVEMTATQSNLDDCDFGVQEIYGNMCQNNQSFQFWIDKFTRERGLADIFNSTPDVLEPTNERLAITSYQDYANQEIGGVRNAERDPFLFVGTNDGVLHAFDVWALDVSGVTLEPWGYIPRPLLRQLRKQYPIPPAKVTSTSYSIAAGPDGGVDGGTGTQLNGTYQHLYLLDGSPVARDVRLYRNPDGSGNDPWRAIVFGGLGKGGRGYYAIDVTSSLKRTNPTKPLLRWEISPENDLWGNNERLAFTYLGFPLSRPALAYPYFRDDITGTPVTLEVAVAILPGGWFESPDVSSGVYIVRMADGKLIRHLMPGVAAAGNKDICKDENNAVKAEYGLFAGEGAQLVGEPAIPFGTQTMKITTEAFMGDDRGRLWMIDMSDPLPENWCLRRYFDTLLSYHYPYQDCFTSPDPDPCDDPPETYAVDMCYHDDCCAGGDHGQKCTYTTLKAPRSPILSAPTMAQDKDGVNHIIFGTGMYDGLATLSRNRIFSLKDELGAKPSNLAQMYHKAPVINWWIGDWLVDNSKQPPVSAVPSALQWIHYAMSATGDSATQIDISGTWDETGGAWFFNVGEKLVGKPIVFDQVAYFTTFVPVYPPDGDACRSGGSRIWGVQFDNRNGTNGEWETEVDENDFGQFPYDPAANSYKFFTWAPGDLLSGASIVRRPQCYAPGEMFQIVVQRANPAFNPRQPPQGQVPAIQTVSHPIPKNAGIGVTRVRFDSWSLVFE
ncbi:MAG: PilC/PilY family type IV pilus protein, partial [Deltaproteobacteria bacterium]|nr:PilC/PilY family type IV pilus protein [Deltaproteobacteria bacterium]